jgi:hypothetical protein
MSAAVVIPLHKNELSPDERLSVGVICHVLGGHPLIGVGPKRVLDAPAIRSLPLNSFEVFDDARFDSIGSYNRLMLSADFYARFARYEHVLLAQPDTLVFRDELLHWCSLPYDYIGAPWAYPWAYWPPWLNAFKRLRSALYRQLGWRHSHGARRKWCAQCVGNGGFSLRRIPAFLDVLARPPPALAAYLEHGLPDYPEDFFWGIDANRPAPRLRVPDWQTALAFAVESAPQQALGRLGKLPFGTHAWDRGFREFWLAQLRSAGLDGAEQPG